LYTKKYYCQIEGAVRIIRMTYAEQVYTQIVRKIKDGHLHQGDKLVEDRLAADLGISRTPVREALSRLLSRGLAEVSSGRTLSIRCLARNQVIELYEMRQILEGAAARLAAKHASRAEVVSLGQILEAMNPKGKQGRLTAQNVANLNSEFHHAIIQATHNQYLQDQIAQLSEFLWLLKGTTFSLKGRPEVAYIEHRKIFEAIEQGKESEAESAAREHIEMSLQARLSIGV
jgi:DNA-binding GntR family transcriptional regulator